MATDYDITLTANIVFVESEMRENLSSALGGIFSTEMNNVFADMGKKITEGMAQALEQDSSITDKMGKAIANSIANHYPVGSAGPAGEGTRPVVDRILDAIERKGFATYAPPGSYGAISSGQVPTRTREDISREVEEELARRSVTEADIGQTILGPLTGRMGKGIWKHAFQSNAAKNLVGKLAYQRKLEKGNLTELASGELASDEMTPGMSVPTKEGVMDEAMGEGLEAFGPYGVLAKAAIEVAQAVNATFKPGLVQGAQNYVGMIGGPGISAGAAFEAGAYTLAGMDEVSQVTQTLAQSGLERGELQQAVSQAALALYGYGMTTSTATDFLSYQYEILGSTTEEVTESMSRVAGAAMASGMSMEQFTQMMLGGARSMEEAGYGAGSVEGATTLAQGVRSIIPGMATAGDLQKLTQHMPTSPLEWRAAEVRLGVPLSEMGPSMLGGPEGGTGGFAWVAAEASYAGKMFGDNKLLGIEYMMKKFPGLNMEQAGRYFEMSQMGSPKDMAHSMEIEARRAGAITEAAGRKAADVRKYGGFLATTVKQLPFGMGENLGSWMQFGVDSWAGSYAQRASEQTAGMEAKYGGQKLDVKEFGRGGLEATRGGLTVRIEPSDQFKASVFEANNDAEADYAMQMGHGLY